MNPDVGLHLKLEFREFEPLRLFECWGWRTVIDFTHDPNKTRSQISTTRDMSTRTGRKESIG